MRAYRAETEPAGQPAPVQRQTCPAHPTGPGRGDVREPVGGLDPVQVAHGLLSEAAQVVAERGRLGGLQVSRVGPERAGLPGGLVRDRTGEGGHVGVQAEQPVPQGEAERDAACLAASPAQVKAAGRRAEFALQFPFPAVVGVAVHRVIGEIAGR